MNILIACKQTEKIEKLRKFLHQYDESIKIIGGTTSIGETLRQLENHEDILDLTIIDTDLADSQSIDFFKRKRFKNRIVFTSQKKSDAYEAIKAGCLDFLLEPVSYRDIEWSLNSVGQNQKIRQDDRLLPKQAKFKRRFIVKFGDRIRYIKADEISCILAEGKLAYICTKTNSRKYIIEHTLDELEKCHLDPDNFFRINRKFIVNIDAIEEVRNYANSRLKLTLNSPVEHDMIVSREKVNDFKSWLNL
jgi:DNA-binding LytR/AlgR family response regulator